MEITKIQIEPYLRSNSSISAFVDIVLDNSLKIRGVMLCSDNSASGFKLVFPNKKMRNKTLKGIVYPISSELYNKLLTLIVIAYRKANK